MYVYRIMTLCSISEYKSFTSTKRIDDYHFHSDLSGMRYNMNYQGIFKGLQGILMHSRVEEPPVYHHDKVY